MGNGGGCTSTPTSFAVGVGNKTVAIANGLFNGAVALGNKSTADSKGALSVAFASGTGAGAATFGNLNAAVAVGTNAVAVAGENAGDIGNLAVDIGNNTLPVSATAGGTPTSPGFGNVAIDLGNTEDVEARGALNSAFNIGGNDGAVAAAGVANTAVNLFGNENRVVAAAGSGLTSPGLSAAFNIGGNNVILAGDSTNPALGGPFAIAGAIGVSNHNGLGTNPPAITQKNAGFNVKTPLNP
ncbi:MAG: hypothetical protein JO280_16995 [Mycobacteriaceae bacterium]|nr:hypothetical protein [Mycobacteriaceae bacterium]